MYICRHFFPSTLEIYYKNVVLYNSPRKYSLCPNMCVLFFIPFPQLPHSVPLKPKNPSEKMMILAEGWGWGRYREAIAGIYHL